MLARLRDVENQLWRAATAVQLHVRLVSTTTDNKEDEDEVMDLCDRVEKVQRELLQSTSEMLALARKTMADDGDETETEDEMEEAMGFAGWCEEEQLVQTKKEVVENWEEEGGAEAVELQEQKLSVDENEEPDRDENHAKERDFVLVDTTPRLKEFETCNRQELLQHEKALGDVPHEDEEAKEEVEMKDVGRTEASAVFNDEEHAALGNTNGQTEETVCEENHDYTMDICKPSSAPPGITSTESQTNGNDRPFKRRGDVGLIEFVTDVEQAQATTIETADNGESPANTTTTDQNVELGSDSIASNEDICERIACMKQCYLTMKKIGRSELSRCLQTGIGNLKVVTSINDIAHSMATIVRRSPKVNSRLWIERLLKALSDNFATTSRQEFLQLFTPVLEGAASLQKYCDAHYTNYLQDMLYDVQTFEYMTQTINPNQNELCALLRFLLDQLQLDCSEYSSNTNNASRSVRQWSMLQQVCDSLVLCLKKVSPDPNQFPTQYLTKTIKVLGEFDATFPKRLPVELLESLICMASKNPNTSTFDFDEFTDSTGPEPQHTELQQRDAFKPVEDKKQQERTMTQEHTKAAAAICVENPAIQFVISCDIKESKAGPRRESKNLNDSSSKKRPRCDSDGVGPDLKKPMRSDSLQKVNSIAHQYLTAAHTAKKMIVYTKLPSTDAQATKAISDLKTLATQAIIAVLDYSKTEKNLDRSTMKRVSVGTAWMASTVYNLPGNLVGYTWLFKTTTSLRQILYLASCASLKEFRDSLSANVDTLDTYLRKRYVHRKGHAALNKIENRVRRYQDQLPIFTTFKDLIRPVQSISDVLLKHLDEYKSPYEGRYVIQSRENWARIMATGEALAEWMSRALQCRVRGSYGLFERLLARLLTFERNYPARLPLILLRNAKLLCEPSSPLMDV